MVQPLFLAVGGAERLHQFIVDGKDEQRGRPLPHEERRALASSGHQPGRRRHAARRDAADCRRTVPAPAPDPNGLNCGTVGGDAYRYGSYHPGGLTFLFADGSVRIVSRSTSRATWRAMSTYNAGEVLGPDAP